jgi:hypothetical protein
MSEEPGEQGLVSHVGWLEIDWPRVIGYYGGIGAAVTLGMIEWPIGLFIGAVPFFKILERPDASFPVRTVGQILDGAALPVGGDSPSAIRTSDSPSSSRLHVGRPMGGLLGRLRSETASIWNEAQTLR